MRNELEEPRYWEEEEMFFREGDSLTPEDYPNTGLSLGSVYNGRFTGVSFTDFVTGDNPSFKVSFSDEVIQQPEPVLSLETESLDTDLQLTLVSDQPLVQKKQHEEDYEAPYLIDADGTKLLLDFQAGDFARTRFRIRYKNASPVLQPDTEYTLVIPTGYFMSGYAQEVPEFREKITTESFLVLTQIERYSQKTGIRYSNTFAVTDNTYGRIEMDADTRKCDFIELNLNGEEIARSSFTAPVSYLSPKYLLNCSAYRLYDGNYALCVHTIDDLFFIKFDQNGDILSDVFTLSADQLDGYAANTMEVGFVPFMDGLFRQTPSADYRSQRLITVDFVNEPTVSEAAFDDDYIPLDRNHYIRKNYRDEHLHLDVYDESDTKTADIIIEKNYLGVCISDDTILVLSRTLDYDEYDKRVVTLYYDAYNLNGVWLGGEDITERSEDLKTFYQVDRLIPTDSGYFVQIDDEFDNKKEVLVCDREWNKLGSFSFPMYNELEYLGECGLNTAYQYFADEADAANIISRFNIGEFEIVPKREQLLGDANLDGEVDITDATTIQRYDVKMIELSDTALQLADVDKDGDVCIIDATWIQRWDLKMKAPEGIGEKFSE